MSRQLQTSSALVWICGAALLVLCAVYAMASALGMHLGPGGSHSGYHIAGLMFSAAIYLVAVRLGQRTAVSVAPLFALGLAMRLVLLAAPPAPNLQDDYYRYLWDGSLVARGLNPYQFSPQEALAAIGQEARGDSPLADAAASAQKILPRVNHPNLTTIYPPVAQGAFALSYLLRPFSVTGLRTVFLGFDLATFALLLALLRRLEMGPGPVLVYWWNPVVLNWIYGEVHMDVLLFPFVLLAVIAALSRRPLLTGASVALAVGVKLWPVVLLPVLAWRWRGSWRRVLAGVIGCAALTFLVTSPMFLTRSAAPGGLWTYAESWQNNAGLYALMEGALSLRMSYVDARFLARLLTLTLLGLWILLVVRRQQQTPQALVRACLLVVAAIFLLSPTQFPWYYTWTLPFLAFWPSPALLAYTLFLPLYDLTLMHPWVVWLEHGPFWLILAWELRRPRQRNPESQAIVSDRPIPVEKPVARVAVIIPALNEELSIARVLGAIPGWVSQIVVVDNGSTDRTAAVATAAGAQIVSETRRGYGAACLAGMAALDKPDVVVFLDADFSDDPSEMAGLVAPIARGRAELVIGSRTLGSRESGALSAQQRFGNALACWLIRMFWRVSYTDLGPFRAIRSDALGALEMDDQGYGWTVQMQLRAARLGLSVAEVPVSYRRRIGRSKISGTFRGVLSAGAKILSLIAKERLWRPKRRGLSRERLVVFARYPVPGETKTRLIGHLGEEGAAALQDAMTRHTLAQVASIVRTRSIEAEIRFAGGEKLLMAEKYGREWTYVPQGEGDLGQRLRRAVQEAFDAGVARVVFIGTDCPALTPASLLSAFDALDGHDLVIGPATDGGYYLLGLRQPCLQLFTDIAWGTDAVFHQTVGAAEGLRLSVRLLTPHRDVDRPEDLSALETIRG